MASRITIPLSALAGQFNMARFQGAGGSLTTRFSNLRPLGDFFDLKRVSKPANFGEVQSRVSYNLSHFSSNYAVVILMFFIYTLLTNLLLLFVIVFVIGGLWGIGKLEGRDLEVGPIKATTSQLWTALLVISVPLGLYSGPFSAMLWLIGASSVTILGHASFLDKPIENAFGEEAV